MPSDTTNGSKVQHYTLAIHMMFEMIGIMCTELLIEIKKMELYNDAYP